MIKKHALQNSDVITVGHHQLRFVDGDDDGDEADEFEKTMVINPSSQSQDKIDRVRQQVAEAVASPGSLAQSGRAGMVPMAKLQVLSGTFAGRELELKKALTTLGRPGLQVAAITRRAEGYYVVHVDGGKDDRHPSLNGESIGSKAARLEDNDVIEIAGVKMGFFLT